MEAEENGVSFMLRQQNIFVFSRTVQLLLMLYVFVM